MVAIPETTLRKDPAPATSPTPAVEIRTDLWNNMVDILNGVDADFTNLVHQLATKTGSYTIIDKDFMILADATSGGFTITLPAAGGTGITKKIIAIKKIDSTSNKVTIDGNAAETIDGKTTIDLETENEILMLQSDGTNWVIVASYLAIIDNGLLKIRNPAGTFSVAVKTSAEVANRSATIPLIGADDTFVMINLAQNLRSKNLFDSNGNEILLTVGVASAVNELTLTNAATGNPVKLDATGGDTNIGISILPKGTGDGLVDNLVGTGTKRIVHEITTTTVALDLDNNELESISISANTTFTTANRASGKSKTIRIITDSTLRTLTFPAWKFVGPTPADQAASKTGILTITAFGTADTDIVAAYAVEE